MQELEKILEEMRQIKDGNRKENLYAKYPPNGKDQEVLNAYSQGYEDGTDNFYNAVVYIIRKYMENDGWISVSQNVPVNSNPVLIWSVNSEQKSEGFSIGSYDYGEWWIGMFEGILTFPTFLKPIAWRPLPEPYRMERSDNHERRIT